MKISTVFTLSGHIEVSIKHKIGQTEQNKEVVLRNKPSDSEVLELE